VLAILEEESLNSALNSAWQICEASPWLRALGIQCSVEEFIDRHESIRKKDNESWMKLVCRLLLLSWVGLKWDTKSCFSLEVY
jgi:hypothetical protein